MKVFWCGPSSKREHYNKSNENRAERFVYLSFFISILNVHCVLLISNLCCFLVEELVHGFSCAAIMLWGYLCV